MDTIHFYSWHYHFVSHGLNVQLHNIYSQHVFFKLSQVSLRPQMAEYGHVLHRRQLLE